MKKYKVTYSATFQAVVALDTDLDSIDDVVSDIDIPEGGQHNSVYKEDSFDVINVEPFDEDSNESEESDDESTTYYVDVPVSDVFQASFHCKADAISWIREHVGYCDDDGKICLLTHMENEHD